MGMDFDTSTTPTEAQTRAMAAALRSLASVDGDHPSEILLIDAFLGEAPGADAAHPITAAELAAALPEVEHRYLFLKTALLVAHADGGVSDAEGRLIHTWAEALEVHPFDLLVMEMDLLDEFKRRARAK